MTFGRCLPAALGALVLLAGCGQLSQPMAANLAASGLDAQHRAHRGPDPNPAVDTQNFAKVNATLYRGGMADAQQWAALAKLGIKTDICLQDPTSPKEGPEIQQEKATIAPLKINFINLAVGYDTAPTPAMIQTWFQTLATPADLPAYVHCTHGRDRTGTMVAIYHIQHDGWTNQQALTDMESFGFNPQQFPHYAQFVLSFKPAPAFAI